ncbi:hypothetical protein L0F63_002391 [Massospora cicadina]|nr:hypothetical protein L0F63_002391 [Massospora cicadina]
MPPPTFNANRVRHRNKLTQRESNLLESLFRLDCNPRLVVRKSLAHQMGMRQRTIQIWFQNRRAKALRLNEPNLPTTRRPNHVSNILQVIFPNPMALYQPLELCEHVKISEFWATTMSCIKYCKY